MTRVGVTYARIHFDLSRAFATGPASGDGTVPSRADLRRLGYRFSTSVDDAVRERITATIAGGDPTQAADLQKRFANDQLLEQSTQAIRVFGLHETDLGDVASALVVAGYNASHAVALTAPQGLGVSRQLRRAMLASPVLPALDDATKQTIATEMQYQILFWEADTSTYRYAHDRATYGALITSIVDSLKSLGIPLASLRPTDEGLEIVSK